ncbi:12871_t:CDS:2 [Ambispora leptoticha]|uniref:12871_t:CDS:1 n=1 Tax=Ambispora leptoticha TaxID=144679 RepID=A0A9N8WHA9_9GLOM|nr:12871_t:CDS:2 [Ambispora leptoticha]
MSFGGFLAVVISLLALGAIVVTFPKPGKIPAQVPSGSTGLPSWQHGTDIDQNRLYSIVTFSFLLQMFGAIYVFKWTNNTANIPRKVISYFSEGIDKTRTTTYNRLLAFYLLFTALAALALLAFNIGKLWEAFGLWHNLWEMAILTLLNQGGKIKSVSRYVLGLGIYFIGTNTIILFLNWPLDAVFFKFQGLVIDFLQFIFYTRIYLNTRKRDREEAEARLPLDSEESENGGGRHEEASKPILIEHPKQLLLLVAATFELNIPHLIHDNIPAFCTICLLGYTRVSQKRIYLPKPVAWKTAVIIIWSFFLSLLAIRLSYGDK